jgi:nucleotide-binding universal stress UspA family protein
MSKKPSPASTARRKFLVVVDQSPECKVALRFAARRAQHTGGVVTLLCVIGSGDFQQWAGVERVIREEAHQEAEHLLHEAAKVVNDLIGSMPELIVREGSTAEEVVKLIREDKAISILVLGASLSKEGPGPLVSLIGQVNTYPIPVTIVPGNLTDEQIDVLS